MTGNRFPACPRRVPILMNMEENQKIKRKRHYDTKIPCPSCNERIGVVQPHCPFCGEAIPFWGDRGGKLLLSLGFCLASGSLFFLFYFWEDGSYLFSGHLLKGFVLLALAVTSAAGASRY